MVEFLSYKQEVTGSSPVPGTNFDEESPGYAEFLQRVAEIVSREAVEEALRHGLSITYLENGTIWQEKADGTRTALKHL